jgi:uncharacterized protein YdiU (UPF0061 family)
VRDITNGEQHWRRVADELTQEKQKLTLANLQLTSEHGELSTRVHIAERALTDATRDQSTALSAQIHALHSSKRRLQEQNTQQRDELRRVQTELSSRIAVVCARCVTYPVGVSVPCVCVCFLHALLSPFLT